MMIIAIIIVVMVIVLDVVTKYEYYSRHDQLMSELSLKRQQSKILEHFKASMK